MNTQTLPRPSRTAGSEPIEDGEFFLIRGVPVFAEHQTKAKDGRTLKFGRAELTAVASRNNERIRLSGDYVPITIGHTPDPMAVMLGQAQQPEVVGFAGPFTLGKIGPPGQERYSILADFRIFKEDWNRVRKFPRRSPELWLEDSYDKMFLDPICLLGAETPRLDMGVLYAASLHGRTVEKYTAVAPSAGNSFVPSEKYAADGDGDEDDNPEPPTPEGTDPDAPAEPKGESMNEEKLVAMFLEAFRQSDMGQWVMQQMQKDAAPQPSVPQPPVPTSAPVGADPSAPTPGGPPGGPPGAPPDASALGGLGGPPGAPPPAGGDLGGAPTAPPPLPDSSATGGVPPDVDKEKMNAGGMMPYSRPASDRVAALEQRLARMEAELVNERRVGQLMELVATGVPIEDPRGLVTSRLNYAKATDEQFGLVVEQYARQARMPLLDTFLPTPGADDPTAATGGPERYSKAHADRAMQICNEQIRAGKQPDYTAVLREVQAGRA